MPTAAAPFVLVAFDARRGNVEGQEADKVLGFHPAGAPPDDQAAAAGLLQGLALFAAPFRPPRRGAAAAAAAAAAGPEPLAIDAVETDAAVWVVLQPERGVFLAAGAHRSALPRHATPAALRALLVRVHRLATLLHGRLQALLDADASGDAARAALAAPLAAAGAALGDAGSGAAAALRNPLGDAGAAAAARPPPGAAAAARAYCHAVLLAPAPADAGAASGSRGPPPLLAGLVLLHGGLVVWSSEPPCDTAALHALACETLLGVDGGAPGGGGGAGLLSSGAWRRLPGGFLVPAAGGGGSANEGDDTFAPPPAVHLSRGQRLLLPLRAAADGALLLLALLPARASAGAAELRALHAAAAGAPAAALAAALGGAAETGGHIAGFRYLLQEDGTAGDGPAAAAATLPSADLATASPRPKISGMSHHARAVAAALRNSLGAGDGGPAAGEGSSSGSEYEDDGEGWEVAAASVQNVWAAARGGGAGGARLLAVRERRGERDAAAGFAALDELARALL